MTSRNMNDHDSISERIRLEKGPLSARLYEDHVSEAQNSAALPSLGIGAGTAYVTSNIKDRLNEDKRKDLIHEIETLGDQTEDLHFRANQSLYQQGGIKNYNDILTKVDDNKHTIQRLQRHVDSIPRIPDGHLPRAMHRGLQGGAAGLVGMLTGSALLGTYAGGKAHHAAFEELDVDPKGLPSQYGDEDEVLPSALTNGATTLGGGAIASTLGARLLHNQHRTPSNRMLLGVLGSVAGGAIGQQVNESEIMDRLRKEATDTPGTLEKQGSLLGMLGIGTLMHVAPNIAMKAVKSTDAGHRALTNTFAAGVTHGTTGRKLHPNLDAALTYGIGPESLLEYRIGRNFGQRITKYGDDAKDFYLAALKRNIQHRFGKMNPEQQQEFLNTPLVGTLKRYFDGEGEGAIAKFLTGKSVQESAKTTIPQHIGNAAMLGGAAAVDPHLLVQPGISYARKQLSQSDIGKRFLKKQFNRGEAGEIIHPAKMLATDLIVSPGVLDPYRVGKTVSNSVSKEVRDRAKPVLKNIWNNKKEGKPLMSKDQLMQHVIDNESDVRRRVMLDK